MKTRFQSGGKNLGIIAGAGQFPTMVLQGAKRAGCSVFVVGLRGLADEALRQDCDQFCWSGLAKPGRWIRILKRFKADRVILAGSVKKTCMYGRFRMLKFLPDWTGLKIWFFRIKDKRNDTVLSALADEFARHGIVMDECTRYCEDDLAPEGVLTKCQPTASQLRDAEFGWPLAKELGRLDIGQAIAVKETEVIAVEAIEGTDRMIERTGQLCPRGGWTLIKTAKPNQDMRFDVPTVGPETISKLRAHNARMLVIEAGRTVIVDRDKTVSAADAAGIVLLGRTDQSRA
ncbi:MAG: UDP-2,3-diacylglucosamine diphosphatase LpxI [Planctomycetota bacterium]